MSINIESILPAQMIEFIVLGSTLSPVPLNIPEKNDSKRAPNTDRQFGMGSNWTCNAFHLGSLMQNSSKKTILSRTIQNI